MKNEDLFDIGKDIERLSEEKRKFYFDQKGPRQKCISEDLDNIDEIKIVEEEN